MFDSFIRQCSEEDYLSLSRYGYLPLYYHKRVSSVGTIDKISLGLLHILPSWSKGGGCIIGFIQI